MSDPTPDFSPEATDHERIGAPCPDYPAPCRHTYPHTIPKALAAGITAQFALVDDLLAGTHDAGTTDG